MFELSPPDFLYSIYRPDLAALGAVDGRPASGLPQDNDDALSRRDMGLEFLDVTDAGERRAARRSSGDDEAGHRDSASSDGCGEDDGSIGSPTTASPVDTHLLVVASGLSFQIEMTNASGRTSAGDPYRPGVPAERDPRAGSEHRRHARFQRHRQSPSLRFTLTLLSGQGNP